MFRFLPIFLIFLFPFTSLAQIGDLATGPTFQIELSEPYPEPYQTINARINDYSLPGSTNNITWKMNNIVKEAEKNKREINVPVGEVGEVTKIEAIISASGGNVYLAEVAVSPAYIDIIVEPQTRTPSFYAGRALPSAGSNINFTAVTSHDKLGSSNLVYTWTVNDVVLGGGPQLGKVKNSYYTHMYEKSIKLTLKIENNKGLILGEKNISFLLQDPKLLFYELDPLIGQKTKPIMNDLVVTGNSVALKAEPYYLDLQTYNAPGLIEWKIGKEKVENFEDNPYELILNKAGSGKEKVNFHVRNTIDILQGTEGFINISY